MNPDRETGFSEHGYDIEGITIVHDVLRTVLESRTGVMVIGRAEKLLRILGVEQDTIDSAKGLFHGLVHEGLLMIDTGTYRLTQYGEETLPFLARRLKELEGADSATDQQVA
jgi:hypothetical protein